MSSTSCSAGRWSATGQSLACPPLELLSQLGRMGCLALTVTPDIMLDEGLYEASRLLHVIP
jgi:hypothetical protein